MPDEREPMEPCPACGSAQYLEVGYFDLRCYGWEDRVDEPPEGGHSLGRVLCILCGVQGPAECACVAEKRGGDRHEFYVNRWNEFIRAFRGSAAPVTQEDSDES